VPPAIHIAGFSGAKRKAKLQAIKSACQTYIADTLQAQLADLLRESLSRVQIVQARPAHRTGQRPSEPAVMIFQRDGSGEQPHPAGGEDQVWRKICIGPALRGHHPALGLTGK
jgi:hypothetical protein